MQEKPMGNSLTQFYMETATRTKVVVWKYME